MSVRQIRVVVRTATAQVVPWYYELIVNLWICDCYHGICKEPGNLEKWRPGWPQRN